MTKQKSDGRSSAQGGKIKHSYKLVPIPDDEKPAKQTVDDLGARWGVGQEEEGPRTKKWKRPSSPTVPGGLGSEVDQEKVEPGEDSLDQTSKEVGDRLDKDQDRSSKDESDRPTESQDRPSTDGGDWPGISQD